MLDRRSSPVAPKILTSPLPPSFQSPSNSHQNQYSMDTSLSRIIDSRLLTRETVFLSHSLPTIAQKHSQLLKKIEEGDGEEIKRLIDEMVLSVKMYAVEVGKVRCKMTPMNALFVIAFLLVRGFLLDGSFLCAIEVDSRLWACEGLLGGGSA